MVIIVECCFDDIKVRRCFTKSKAIFIFDGLPTESDGRYRAVKEYLVQELDDSYHVSDGQGVSAIRQLHLFEQLLVLHQISKCCQRFALLDAHLHFWPAAVLYYRVC
jgi:hypothetical protein